MRRILMLLTVALVMAAMMVAMAMPAFADHSAGHTTGQGTKELAELSLESEARPGASESAPGAFNAKGPK